MCPLDQVKPLPAVECSTNRMFCILLNILFWFFRGFLVFPFPGIHFIRLTRGFFCFGQVICI